MDTQELLRLYNCASNAFFEPIATQTQLQRIMNAAKDLCDADRATVFLLGKNKTELVSIEGTGLEPGAIRIGIDQGIAGYVHRASHAMIFNDIRANTNFLKDIDELTHYETRTVLCCPITGLDGQALGVLQLLNQRQGRFFDLHLHALRPLLLLLAVALGNGTSKSDNPINSKHWERPYHQFSLETQNAALRQLYDQMPYYAESDSAVLLLGESGTGKEYLARYIHLASKRQMNKFIAINCAAIPEDLFEAELFGVAHGAATGTVARKGKIELADNGTLFLDEIGDLPMTMQAKLLRVLQDKVIARVGSEDEGKHVDFRLITATNQDLEALVKQKKFREDLYYRLNVIRLDVPPLREHKEDIPLLCQQYLNRLCIERGWKSHRISDGALKMLVDFSWPGNIRELQNRLESAAVLCQTREQIEISDLRLPTMRALNATEPSHAQSASSESALLPIQSLKEAREKFEKDYIGRTLRETNGNKSKAAKLLGVSREGLRQALMRKRA